ncbi:hypothetical protein Ocin01_16556 [Orchesella cincta]|uniref:Uncharacterized protein n=1 Tax=Orchesella cincta TaxID=48709 RepID=A0A1D2MAW4_ORCCI|nr:hypothetical protein Ocin01_16556 [Orchesella cincta]
MNLWEAPLFTTSSQEQLYFRYQRNLFLNQSMTCPSSGANTGTTGGDAGTRSLTETRPYSSQGVARLNLGAPSRGARSIEQVFLLFRSKPEAEGDQPG